MPILLHGPQSRRWILGFCCLLLFLPVGCGSDGVSKVTNGEKTEQAERAERAEQAGDISDESLDGARVITIRGNQSLEFNSSVDADPKSFAATVAAACSSAKKEIEEKDPVAARAYEQERVVQRRRIELGIKVEGKATVGLLNDVVHELRLMGFDKFVLLNGESRIPVPGSNAVSGGSKLIKLELLVEADGSPCGANITLGDKVTAIETSGIDFIIGRLRRQIEELEPPQEAARINLEFELIPATKMSAVHFFRFCAALQSLIDEQEPESVLDIKQFPLGYPREAGFDMKEVIEGADVQPLPDLLRKAEPQKELSEFDLDRRPCE